MLKSQTLEEFKNRILFEEIHMAERRDDDFTKLCYNVDYCLRRDLEFYSLPEGPYISFLKLAGAILRRELLIQLCIDLKSRADWKALHYVWNEGDDNYYQDYFQRQIDLAKKLLLKLKPHVLKDTRSWTRERKEMDVLKPEGRFLKGWFLEGEIKQRRSALKH